MDLKPVWVYIIVASGQPFGITVGASEHECFVNGGRWLSAHPEYANVLAICLDNKKVDEAVPNLRWL